MSEPINDGGSAFPMAYNEGTSSCSPQGMTLRDYFAAHAPLPKDDLIMQEHCEFRYHYADAMLTERSKSK